MHAVECEWWEARVSWCVAADAIRVAGRVGAAAGVSTGVQVDRWQRAGGVTCDKVLGRAER